MSKLILGVIKPILLISCFSLLLNQTGVPEAQQIARALKVADQGFKSFESGGWYRQPGEYIHVSAITPDGQILGVTRHQFDKELRLKQTSFAKTGYYSNERQGWFLEDVELTTLISDQRIEKGHLDEMFWSTELTEEMLRVILVPPVELPISGLSSYSSYLDDQGVDSTSYELALWNKLLQPFSIIALVMIGVAFIFGPLRGVTVGQRIITGVVIGLVFKFSQDLLAPASQVLGFSPLLAALLPIAISFAIALWLLSRVR
jgi:lipopolysaccharide export system permease protein